MNISYIILNEFSRQFTPVFGETGEKVRKLFEKVRKIKRFLLLL